MQHLQRRRQGMITDTIRWPKVSSNITRMGSYIGKTWVVICVEMWI